MFLGIPKNKIKWFQMKMLEHVKENYSEIIRELQEEKILTDELTENILKAVEDAKKCYLN